MALCYLEYKSPHLYYQLWGPTSTSSAFLDSAAPIIPLARFVAASVPFTFFQRSRHFLPKGQCQALLLPRSFFSEVPEWLIHLLISVLVPVSPGKQCLPRPPSLHPPLVMPPGQVELWLLFSASPFSCSSIFLQSSAWTWVGALSPGTPCLHTAHTLSKISRATEKRPKSLCLLTLRISFVSLSSPLSWPQNESPHRADYLVF